MINTFLLTHSLLYFLIFSKNINKKNLRYFVFWLEGLKYFAEVIVFHITSKYKLFKWTESIMHYTECTCSNNIIWKTAFSAFSLSKRCMYDKVYEKMHLITYFYANKWLNINLFKLCNCLLILYFPIFFSSVLKLNRYRQLTCMWCCDIKCKALIVGKRC